MPDIVNIKNSSSSPFDLKKQVREALEQPFGMKKISSIVLYDDRSLQLFDKVICDPDYYLSIAEMEILKNRSDEIIEIIPDGSLIIELGAGSLRKTRLILDAVDSKRKNINYYALDLMENELKKSLGSLSEYKNITTHGLCGTYDDGVDYIASFPNDKPKILLWFGTSIGNLTRQEAEDFLNRLRSALNPRDCLLVGFDLHKEASRINSVYNTENNAALNFIMNGLNHCNNLLDYPVFDQEKFSYFSKFNSKDNHHEFKYLCNEDHCVEYIDPNSNQTHVFSFKKNEEILVLISVKYTQQEISNLIKKMFYNKGPQWLDSTNSYSLKVIYKPEPSKPCPFHKEIFPSITKASNHDLVYDAIKSPVFSK